MRILALFFVLFSHNSLASFDWSDLSSLLAKNIVTAEKSGITTSLVDYQNISKEPKFIAILEQLADYDPSKLKGKEKLAFYINAYNLLAIKLVIDHHPKKSIRDIGTWFSPVWQKPAGVLNGKTISLDTIEHKILRKLGEPRIHFAIVCSSLSCPDLRAEAYNADRLDEQLDQQTRKFLSNKNKGMKIEKEKVYISKIFDWFIEDFSPNKSEQGVLSFIAKYNIEAGRFSEYRTLDYNWQLNKQ